MFRLISLGLSILLIIYYVTIILELIGVKTKVVSKDRKVKIMLGLIPFYYWFFPSNPNPKPKQEISNNNNSNQSI